MSRIPENHFYAISRPFALCRNGECDHHYDGHVCHVPRSYAIALATGLFFLDKPIITPGSRMGSRREAHQQWQAI